MRRASSGRTIAILAVAVALAVLAAACSRTATLIPGEEGPTPAAPDANATPTAVIAPPILPPATVTVAGPEPRESAPVRVVSDADLARSVVQLQVFDASSGLVRLVRNGSGVVVDQRARLILTSYVLVEPFAADGSRAYTLIAVGANRTAGAEPSLEFEAEIVTADPVRDLAVLRATRLYRGGPIGTGEFDLPAVEVGDQAANALATGDALRLLGHPGLDPEGQSGSQAVVSTTATVTGFRGDASIDGRAWLKTDGRLPYGLAGGPAFDASGRLVGIADPLQYDPRAVIGQVRPLTLATELVEQARRAGPQARYRAPLQRSRSLARRAAPADGIVVGKPAFAENADELQQPIALFDYTTSFRADPPALYYEYTAQGIANGAPIEERWYLDEVLQDALSSSFIWSLGPFGVVADRLAAPGARGIPTGVWRLEIWVDGSPRVSSATAVGVPPPPRPAISGIAFASLASEGPLARRAPSAAERQLLAFFDYADAGGATLLRWIVFRDGSVVYQSPVVPWQGGEEGTWWVGLTTDRPIGAGFWEFEIYMDSAEQPGTLISRAAGDVELY